MLYFAIGVMLFWIIAPTSVMRITVELSSLTEEIISIGGNDYSLQFPCLFYYRCTFGVFRQPHLLDGARSPGRKQGCNGSDEVVGSANNQQVAIRLLKTKL